MRPLDPDGLDGILSPRTAPPAVCAEYEPTTRFSIDGAAEEDARTELLGVKPAWRWQVCLGQITPFEGPSSRIVPDLPSSRASFPSVSSLLGSFRTRWSSASRARPPRARAERLSRPSPGVLSLLTAASLVLSVLSVVIFALALWVALNKRSPLPPPNDAPPQPSLAPSAPLLAPPVDPPPQGEALISPSEHPPTEWTLYFDPNTWRPQQTALPEWLRSCSALEIIGYTDAAGSAEDNQRLGSARADGVRSLLLAAGIPPERMTVRSAGEALANTPDATAHRHNDRRAVIRCTHLRQPEPTWSTR